MKLQIMQESFIKQLSQFESDAAFLNQLSPTQSLQPEQQIEIYQNNVRGALQGCLAQIYPICCTILGEPYFKQLAKGYIQHHPSRQSDLNGYGGEFSVFLSIQCQQRSELFEFSYLGDLAQLEWLYHAVYYAASPSVFDFDVFAQLSESQQANTIFQLAPCFEFMVSDYPILSIWQLNRLNMTEQPPVLFHAERVGIFRQDYQISVFELDEVDVRALSLIKAGKTLQALVQANLDPSLPEFIQKGWLGVLGS